MNENNKKYFGVHAVELYTHHNMVGDVFVIQKYDLKEFKYWNKEQRKWKNGIHEATMWPKDEDGQTPYLANNVYSLHNGFKAEGYELVSTYGNTSLFPCSIKKDNLYLHSISETDTFLPFIDKNELLWTTYYMNAMKIHGHLLGIELMWELINADQGGKINKQVLQNISKMQPFIIYKMV